MSKWTHSLKRAVVSNVLVKMTLNVRKLRDYLHLLLICVDITPTVVLISRSQKVTIFTKTAFKIIVGSLVDRESTPYPQ